MNTEIVYLGHDNTIDLLLKSEGVAVDLAATTAMTLTFGSQLISSINGAATDMIWWAKAGYETGEVRISLGHSTITPGTYSAPLVIYESPTTDGIVWGKVKIQIVAEIEAT